MFHLAFGEIQLQVQNFFHKLERERERIIFSLRSLCEVPCHLRISDDTLWSLIKSTIISDDSRVKKIKLNKAIN